ncbi:MAG: HAMP domain-containing sensor histidine kinase [Nitrospirota bacterium]
MPNTYRSKSIVFIAGVAVIALAVLLFVNAMTINDFSRPDQGVLSGRSNMRLSLAFLLVTVLAFVLLVALFRTGRPHSVSRAPVRTVMAGKAEVMIGQSLEDAGGPGTHTSGAILSETAGELRMSVEVIEEELEDILEDEAPADKERLHVLYEETDRLKKIIAGLEQLSQAKEIARASRKELLQIEPLLEGIIEETRQAVRDKDITYAIECEPGLSMQADRECLGRIIGNITDNAARFIRDSGSVTLTAGRREGLVVFSVKDTGTGIRRAHLSHIYEHFFRGAGSGIGMGLSIVKELVDAFGGKINVQTTAGKGTTVTVELPVNS